jgi:serine/threonine-protein kinase
LYWLGLAWREKGDNELGVSYLRHAAHLAGYVSDTALYVDANSQLIWTVGALQERFEEAKRLFEHVDQTIIRATQTGVRRVGDFSHAVGTVHLIEHELDEASTNLQRALEIRREHLGPKHPDTAKSLANIAGLRVRQGKLNEALAMHEKAYETTKQALGPHHPMSAYMLLDVGIIQRKRGNARSAKKIIERAAATVEAAFDRRYPKLAYLLVELGHTMLVLGEHRQAHAVFKRAMELTEKGFGLKHSLAADAFSGLGEVHLLAGRLSDAERCFREALAILQSRPRDLRTSALAQFGLARALWKNKGQNNVAIDLAKKAWHTFSSAKDPEAMLISSRINKWLNENGVSQ